MKWWIYKMQYLQTIYRPILQNMICNYEEGMRKGSGELKIYVYVKEGEIIARRMVKWRKTRDKIDGLRKRKREREREIEILYSCVYKL